MSAVIYGINLESFLRACSMFEEFRAGMNSDRDKAGAIQAFEFSFELAWKTMKRVLHAKGIEARSPRDCFREAASTQLINNPKDWLEFLDKRNLTVHTYDKIVVEAILAIFPQYSAALTDLIRSINHERDKEAGLK